MKCAWAVAAAALISVPILALPDESPAPADIGGLQSVSELGSQGDHMIAPCAQRPPDPGAVAVDALKLDYRGLSVRVKPSVRCRIEYRAG